MEAMLFPSMGFDHWNIRLEMDIKEVPQNWSFRLKILWLRSINFVTKLEQWWGRLARKDTSVFNDSKTN